MRSETWPVRVVDGEILSGGGAPERRDRGSWRPVADSLVSFGGQVRQVPPPRRGDFVSNVRVWKKRTEHVPAHHQRRFKERRMRVCELLLGWGGSFSLTAGRAMHEVGMQLQG